METKMMKRRDFLKISALAGVAVVAAACTPTAAPTVAPKTTEVPKATTAATTAATAAPKATEVPKATAAPTKVGFQGEILFYAQTYTPTSETQNPDPKAPKREAMKTLSEQWMELHPGINLKFMQTTAVETSDHVAWITTQLIGGTGPDVFWTWLSSLNQFADEGKVVPLNDYLELPNKYTPEDKTTWKNTFKSPFLTTFSPKGQWGGIPLDLLASGVYCNVDMFKSLGIDLTKEIVPELGSPKDWATMISWCKKFKEAGFFGFSLSGYVILEWWPQGVLGDQLFWNLTPTFDKLNYHEQTPKEFQEGIISQEELFMQYSCNNWKAFEEPGTRTMFEIIKDLSQYMPEGFASPSTWDASWDLFLQNKLAMFWDGSWRVGAIMQDERRKFEFSSFWLPPLTKETTPLAKDPPILPIGIGGYGSIAYGLNRTCITKGNLEECVDWLMFITTPKNDEMIVNEVPAFIPANKQAKSLPEVENLAVGETRLVAGAGHPWPAPMGWFSYLESKYTDTFKREMTLYLLGEQDLDTFMAHSDAAAKEAFPSTLRAAAVQYSKDGDWDLTRWTCQPTV